MTVALDEATGEPQRTRDPIGIREDLCERVRLPDALARCDTIYARAMCLGERIDLRRLTPSERLGSRPLMLTMSAGPGGVAVLFRYGVVVLFNTTSDSEDAILREMALLVTGPYAVPEFEKVTLRRAPDGGDAIEGEEICLRQFDVERLQLVAVVLSKSVVLAEYEARVAENFDRVEPFAVELQTHGRGGRKMKRLLQQIGNVLLTEHKMVARVEISEKPDFLWEHPQLEPLFLRLENEFEISERSAALQRKLALTSRTVGTVLDLLQNRRTLRVEWYIVILIVLEILLTLYAMFWLA